MKSEVFLIWGTLVTIFYITEVRCQCSKQDYNHCVKLADPLLKDPHLIYPDNPKDIEHVCRTWSFFVDCVKQYTERCFTESRRKEFNKAVENPVNSIHRLCSMPDYRNDYLKHASCMKMTLTQDSHCGRHYRLLVSQVSGEAPTASVCCSHHLFRECVLDHTKNSCEADSAPFSAAMLDKALSFLRDQCSNFIPNQLDCPGADFYKSTSRSETRGIIEQESTVPMTNPVEETRTSMQPVWMVTDSRSTPSTRSETSETWTPTSKVSSTSTSSSSSSSSSSTSESMPDMETTRSSYGRGMTWSTPSLGGTQTWRVSSSEIWLPSSKPPAMIDNSIDEPNQQGLGSDNSGKRLSSGFGPLLLLSVISFYLFR